MCSWGFFLIPLSINLCLVSCCTVCHCMSAEVAVVSTELTVLYGVVAMGGNQFFSK